MNFRNDMTVEAVRVDGDERLIADAAWVSTHQARQGEVTDSRVQGLIRSLMRNGHGTPLEYPRFIFYLEIPIFVDRQLVKYRLTTINGSSGRYSDVRPEFYMTPRDRNVIQVGKSMDYEFEPGEDIHYQAIQHVQRTQAEAAWQNYDQLRQMGIAREVAREHLPLTTYGSMYFQINLRAILNFLSQRMELGEDAAVPSHPQYEITLVAEKMAKVVEENFPTVWEVFMESGYRKL